MQRSLEPWILRFGTDDDGCPVLTLDFFFTLRIIICPLWSMWKSFLFSVEAVSRSSENAFQGLGFNSYGTRFPFFWIIHNALSRFPSDDKSTPSDVDNSSSIWDEFFSMPPVHSYLNFLAVFHRSFLIVQATFDPFAQLKPTYCKLLKFDGLPQ